MQVIKQIGRGGFGVVDLIQDQNGQQFARKTFSVNQPGNFPAELLANVAKRFVREAQVQAALSHPNIMPVVATDLNSNPPSFFMPLAVSSLDEDIGRDRSLGGRALQAIMDILAGLEELHSMGITHRDLKPQNVLRLSGPDGDRYVISDFGLMSVKDTQLSVLTQTGYRMGSDYYTAPEIVAELKNASPQSDIYSIGCILHQIFGTNPRIPCNEITEPGFYSDVMFYCTRREPARRFQSVSALRDALLSLGQANITATAPQVTDFINLIHSSQAIDGATWEAIVDKAQAIYPSRDAEALFAALSLTRISELVAVRPDLAAKLGAIYANWVRDESFDFAACDGIANRLQAFLSVPDLNCQAEAMLALLFMGTSHNRWYVEQKFVAFSGANMPVNLARRIAMEIRVLGRRACRAITHLEHSISFDRASLHPEIVSTLAQVC